MLCFSLTYLCKDNKGHNGSDCMMGLWVFDLGYLSFCVSKRLMMIDK